MASKSSAVMLLVFTAGSVIGNPVVSAHNRWSGDSIQMPSIRLYGGGITKKETLSVQTNGGQIVRTLKCTRLAGRGGAREDTNSWIEVVKDDEDHGGDGKISGKDFCGLVFGDVYPDKCERVRLSIPFFLFDELKISYDRDGVLTGISTATEISNKYSEVSVLQVAREIKGAIEKHLNIELSECKKQLREDHASPEELVLYDTSEMQGRKADYHCQATVRVRKNIYGKYGRRLPNPFYSISFSITDEDAEGHWLKEKKATVHEAFSETKKTIGKIDFGHENLPTIDVERKQISRPYPEEDLKRSVANQPHYDWGDIENSVVVGTEACRAAVELQKRGRHMRTMNLRDKEISQEAVVELANRIDALEKEIKALKANQNP